MPDAEDRSLRAAITALGPGDGEELHVGRVAVRDLAERFDTPFYAYSMRTVTERVAAVRQALGPRVELLYSIKANPLVAIAAHLRQLGVGAEVASLGELHVALAAGHDAAALRFAGPGKTEYEIGTAVALGLGTFHVESLDEVDVVAAAARATGRRVAIAVRVNLPQELAGARMRMGGASSRFGIDVDQVDAALAAVRRQPQLELAGLHVYGGTQCFDAAAFVQQAAALLTHAARWERELGAPLRELDLGGGFGVPLFAGDPTFDLAAAGRGLAELVREHDRSDRRWFVELGRYLVAPAGVYVCRVVRTKCSGGRQHAVLDGGLHHCAAPMGLGSVLRRPPQLVLADAPFAAAVRETTLGGPLCTPLDQFAAELPLGELQPGDLVAVLHAGAYGLSYSPTGFLSHPTPAEIVCDDGRARLVRDRGDERDVLRGQTP